MRQAPNERDGMIRCDTYVTQDQYDFIQRVADTEHTNRSAICRRIIAEWMREHRDAVDRIAHEC